MIDEKTNIAIKKATLEFDKLLREQASRVQKMKDGDSPKDYSRKKKITIGLIEGDGIGPIIMTEAEKLLSYILNEEIIKGKIVLKKIDGLTIENRLKLNKSVPADVLKEIKKCDVLLKGPTETPKGGTMESANVTLRRKLDLFANVRPVQVPEENIDWMFFRENTEGEYVLGSRGVEILDDFSVDFKIITDPGTERIARTAFEYAKANGKTSVAIVTKANIMKKTDGSFSEICHRVAKDYPEIEASDWYVDIMSANLVNKDIRSKFQVFLMPNLYGDILTDEAAEIQGGVGTAGSANIGNKYAMFEAIHGTAPRLIEEGKAEYANPSSIFKACEMMLRHIGYVEQADRLMKALDISGKNDNMTAKEFGEKVISLY